MFDEEKALKVATIESVLNSRYGRTSVKLRKIIFNAIREYCLSIELKREAESVSFENDSGFSSQYGSANTDHECRNALITLIHRIRCEFQDTDNDGKPIGHNGRLNSDLIDIALALGNTTKSAAKKSESEKNQ